MQKISHLMKKTLYIIPFLFMTSLSEIFLHTPREQPMSDVLWYSIFGRISAKEFQTLVLSTKSLGFLFLFAILFGSYISDFWGTVSAVWFTRVKSRRKWGLQKVAVLCLLSSLYTVLLLLFEFIAGIRLAAGWNADRHIILTLLSLFGMISPLLVMICVSVNWVSIRHGTPISICVVLLAVVIFEMIAVFFFDNPLNMVLNPLCFNRVLLAVPKFLFSKILLNLFYTIVVVAGFLTYMENMDIF